jgi:hypothetical protein
VVSGRKPVCRYAHAVTMVGSKLFVFGGWTGEKALNDMWAFDLNSGTIAHRCINIFLLDIPAVQSKPVWDSYESAPGDEKPPPRAGHVLVSTGDRIILFVPLSPSPSPLVIILYRFGGADGRYHYNDTWSFDVLTRKWTELPCTGCIPSPRHSHATALVDDVMYVFGGHGVIECAPADLYAFKLSSK